MGQSGWATEEGTAAYMQRWEEKIPKGHFRQHQYIWLSSIGLGTYLGNHDAATDEQYRQAVVQTVEMGGNVIDSAINYRFQRSERSIGMALHDLTAKGVQRHEIFVATKGGFIPFDGSPPSDIRNYFQATFMDPGIATLSDVIAGCHCMTPKYLLNQLDCSLQNLGLECIDLYYVHNPETQLGEIPREDFNGRLLKAFEALEEAASAGKIRSYGTATWNGFRNDPEAKDYLSLAEILEIANKAGGEMHHFKAIQLPLNLAMSEALTKRNQDLNGERLSVLEASQKLGVSVFCSASILQGQLSQNLSPVIGDVFTGLETDAQRSLQFVRSTPGVGVALVGMKQVAHVEENLRVAEHAPIPREQFTKLFQTS